MIRNPVGGPPFTSADLAHIQNNLLSNLFDALSLPGSSENEYILKAMMRCCMVLGTSIQPLVKDIIGKIAEKLAIVCKNPSKPQFNHYLFETICVLLKGVGKVDKGSITTVEDHLFPLIQTILTEDVTEFLPYVFQVLSLALEMREQGAQGTYMQLFPMLLQPVLWERSGNVPALTKLLQAYVKRAPTEIVSNGHLMGVLGVFQKLIASRAQDHEGFYLLSTLIEHVPWSALQQ